MFQSDPIQNQSYKTVTAVLRYLLPDRSNRNGNWHANIIIVFFSSPIKSVQCRIIILPLNIFLHIRYCSICVWYASYPKPSLLLNSSPPPFHCSLFPEQFVIVLIYSLNAYKFCAVFIVGFKIWSVSLPHNDHPQLSTCILSSVAIYLTFVVCMVTLHCLLIIYMQ